MKLSNLFFATTVAFVDPAMAQTAEQYFWPDRAESFFANTEKSNAVLQSISECFVQAQENKNGLGDTHADDFKVECSVSKGVCYAALDTKELWAMHSYYVADGYTDDYVYEKNAPHKPYIYVKTAPELSSQWLVNTIGSGLNALKVDAEQLSKSAMGQYIEKARKKVVAVCSVPSV